MSPIYYFDKHFKDFFFRHPKISVVKSNNDDK